VFLDGLNYPTGLAPWRNGVLIAAAPDILYAEDTDGDGKADIVWQNTDGTPAVWLMNGTNFLSGAIARGSPGASWHLVSAGG